MRASLVGATAMFATTKGISLEQIEQATGLQPADLADPDGWLPETIVPAIWRLVAQACPDEAIALQMAAVTPFTVFGPLMYVCHHAQDMRTQLQAFIRYQFVMSDRLHIELLEGDDEVTVRVHHPMDAHDGGLGAEVGLGLGARVGRELMEPHRGLMRVELDHPPFGPIAEYEAFFGVPARFGCPTNRLVFHPEALDAPPKQPDPSLFRFIQGHLDQARARVRVAGEGEVLARIRQAVADNAEHAEYGAEALARRVGMSLRKLQRVMAEHGSTVRGVLEEAREANARQLLSDHRLSIPEVSFLLGYSEDRAFRRAFKRWTGVTPAQLRRSTRSATRPG
ncbi:MAG: AraC family transcriptional regulator [Myxococcota bacterium]